MYPEFDALSEGNKMLFLLNNIHHYICKKTGLFYFEAFQQIVFLDCIIDCILNL